MYLVLFILSLLYYSFALQGEYKFSVCDPIGKISEDENRLDHPFERELIGNEVERQSNTNQIGKSHTCNHCSKSFIRPSKLAAHKKAVHNAILSFACDQYDKIFTQSDNLMRHKKIVQQGDLHICDLCEKTFESSVTLATHKKTIHQRVVELEKYSYSHSTERPFACDECEKSFTLLCNLKMHKNVVHQRTRSYACRLCMKRFATFFELNTHSIIHTRPTNNH